MKVFVAGARAIKSLDKYATQRLEDICEKQCDILVGDCYGVDSAVQLFCKKRFYENVTVYASNGVARNNLGNWRIEAVPVKPNSSGFDFYRQKDIAMAEAAECGYMIWDGKSKGTYQNILTLLDMRKKVLVYIVPRHTMIWPRSAEELKAPNPRRLSAEFNNQLSLF